MGSSLYFRRQCRHTVPKISIWAKNVEECAKIQNLSNQVSKKQENFLTHNT